MTRNWVISLTHAYMHRSTLEAMYSSTVARADALFCPNARVSAINL